MSCCCPDLLSTGVTDPRNFELIGVPPIDLLPEVLDALIAQGLDAAEIFRNSVEITRQFLYDPAADDIRDRFKPRWTSRKTLPVVNRTLAQMLPCCLAIAAAHHLSPKSNALMCHVLLVLDPQPKCSAVLRELLSWADRADQASKNGHLRPPCLKLDGTLIFPEDGSEDDLWWPLDACM